jgi:hypothetical protein
MFLMGSSRMIASLRRSIFIRAIALAALLPLGRIAAQNDTYEGCVDARGDAVASTRDDLLPAVALASIEGGKRTVRYNPAVLPRLTPRARFFFYAHECARHALDQPMGAARTLARAQRADCWALATLQRSGALDASELALQELASELNFSEAEWRSLPGPPRTFDLAACSTRGVLRLPNGAPPSDAQVSADRCVQICGDRLWQCQTHCRDSACRGQCESTYDGCEAGCAGR